MWPWRKKNQSDEEWAGSVVGKDAFESSPAPTRSSDAVVASTTAAAGNHRDKQQGRRHRDDAPMTPVVYVVGEVLL